MRQRGSCGPGSLVWKYLSGEKKERRRAEGVRKESDSAASFWQINKSKQEPFSVVSEEKNHNKSLQKSSCFCHAIILLSFSIINTCSDVIDFGF